MIRTRVFRALVAAFLSLSMQGCVTLQKATEAGQQAVTSLGKLNPFDTTGSEFRKLVEDNKLADARQFFFAHYDDYFAKRISADSPPSSEIRTVAGFHFTDRYEGRHSNLLSAVRRTCPSSDPVKWKEFDTLHNRVRQEAASAGTDKLLVAAQTDSDASRPLRLISGEMERCFRQHRTSALVATYPAILSGGEIPSGYPFAPFAASDYRAETTFQRALAEYVGKLSDTDRAITVARLDSLMSDESRNLLVVGEEVRKRKAKWLKDGRIDLAELVEIRDLAKRYGESVVADLVRIGFVDLTASSFRDRNAFDFEISFKQDFGLKLSDASESFFNGSALREFDYIFVTDLSVAKILREFKSKESVQSRRKSGSHTEPNPQYVEASTNYQKALTNYQSTQLSNATSGNSGCTTAACALLSGILKGASSAVSKNRLNEASAALASTPRGINVDDFTPYSYQLVQIDASKVASVQYSLIDVKGRAAYRSDFEVKDHERFKVAFNIDDDDPNKRSLLSSNQSEGDVTTWEKKPISVSIAQLFDPANLNRKPDPFTSIEAFLKPLATRQYADSRPTYVRAGLATVDGQKPATSVASSSSGGSGYAQTIADPRFDSVVIIRNAKAIGAGFYVTPELVLTAYHVVDGSQLVEITFYDGTKTFGKVVDHDVRLDLALVKAQTTGRPASIHEGPIRLGETVEAIGHPKGYEFTITRGVVSAVRRQQGAALKTTSLVEFIQTDTPISPGNSGGPLFLGGAVIGVNDWVRVDKASQNLNFSVSFNEIRDYLNRFQGLKR